MCGSARDGRKRDADDIGPSSQQPRDETFKPGRAASPGMSAAWLATVELVRCIGLAASTQIFDRLGGFFKCCAPWLVLW
jgi:hypothetical protein